MFFPSAAFTFLPTSLLKELQINKKKKQKTKKQKNQLMYTLRGWFFLSYRTFSSYVKTSTLKSIMRFILTKNSALGFISIWELQVMEKLSHIKRHMISRSEFSTILLRTQHSQLTSQPDKLTCFTFPKSSDENKKFSKRIKIATKINTLSCYRFNGL